MLIVQTITQKLYTEWEITMFDFKFDWCKEMECGFPLLDEQHRVLFHIGRDIEQLVITNKTSENAAEILNIICRLRDYSAYHFYFEEEFMRDHHYKNYEQHVKMHEQFKNYILNIERTASMQNPYTALADLKQYLQDWLFQHILFADFTMCKEIRKN